jgi:hypothetical protein
LEGFREYLWEKTYGNGRGLDHCLNFLEWYADYTERFYQLPPDLQRRSPVARGNTLVDFPKQTLLGVASVPPSRQPLRSAVDFCRLRYLNPGAPMDLRMQLGVRDACLSALDRTTHPSAFSIAAHHCRHRLASEALPEYIALSCRNTNRYAARVRYILGTIALILSLVAVFLTIYFSWSRWTRVGIFPVVFIALFSMFSARYSLCVFRYFKRVRDAADYVDDPPADEEARFAKDNALFFLEDGMRPPEPLHTVHEEDEEEEEDEKQATQLGHTNKNTPEPMTQTMTGSDTMSERTVFSVPTQMPTVVVESETGETVETRFIPPKNEDQFVEIQVTDENGAATVVDVADTRGFWSKWRSSSKKVAAKNGDTKKRRRSSSLSSTSTLKSSLGRRHDQSGLMPVRSPLILRQQRYLLWRIALFMAFPMSLLIVSGLVALPEQLASFVPNMSDV